MPLVTTKDMFKKAYEGHYALGLSTSIIWKLSKGLSMPPKKKNPR